VLLTILCTFRPEDVVKAMESCRGKMFLGLEMDISLYEGKYIICFFQPSRNAIHFTETQQYILFVYVARYTRENLTTCRQDVFATGL
jgi:hypothetical protein